MALILCKNGSQVGWHDENDTYGYYKLKQNGSAVEWSLRPINGNYIFKVGDSIGWKFKDFYNIDISYDGDPMSMKLYPGRYKMECWGASGGVGNGAVNPFGLGGYSVGIITFPNPTTVWIYPGQKGANFNDADLGKSGFNGGGYFTPGGVPSHQGGNGGGASDIRLTTGAWNDITSLRSRIIVAGGGGGAQSICGGPNTSAGHGGGLTGTRSYNSGPTGDGTGNYATSYANGGSQTAGGTAANVSGQWSEVGGFGKGADSLSCGSGAGAGYYGGGATYTTGGGGGSSFISGHPGCNAINSAGAHTNQPNHFSGHVFTSTAMTTGVRNGSGLVVITALELY